MIDQLPDTPNNSAIFSSQSHSSFFVEKILFCHKKSHPLQGLFVNKRQNEIDENCVPAAYIILSCFHVCEVGWSSDTFGPEERIAWTELSSQGDQGDRREQGDQGEVSIIIFGMSE